MRSVPTTQLLTPEAQRIGRYIAAGLMVFLVLVAFIADTIERRQAKAQPAAPQIVIMIATPTPQPLAPTATPLPTPEPPTPIIIYEQVPVYIEVPAAPEVAPPTYAAEPTAAPTPPPMLMGERLDEYFTRTGVTPVVVR